MNKVSASIGFRKTAGAMRTANKKREQAQDTAELMTQIVDDF